VKDGPVLCQVVSSVQHATQNELVDEFLALFRPDAIWTTGGGKRLLGLEEIAAFTRQALPGGMQGLTMSMEVLPVLFIRADVAAVKVRQIYTSSDGQPNEAEGELTPLFVMAKDNGTWRRGVSDSPACVLTPC
jgi:uncharacterized protein (TIGR02246 family)